VPPELAASLDAAQGKLAAEPLVLDLRGLSDFTDFFLICHGESERQVLAISDAVEERLQREFDRRPAHVEGRTTGDWVLLDYIDFVVHVFHHEKRQFYRLERLWGDAPLLKLPSGTEQLGTRAAQRGRPHRA
jgi:ribosome-associated protein